MSEFRSGNKGRSHPYPVTPRAGASAGAAFARNFAVGPALEADLTIDDGAGTQIPWASVAVPSTDPEDVPITPRSTGVIVVSGVLSLRNTSTADIVDVQVFIQLNDVSSPIPASERISVPVDDGEGGEGNMVLPFLMQLPTPLVVGVTRTVQILLIADTADVVIVSDMSSSVEVQEVPVATG